MDLFTFIRLTINSRHITRWIYGGLVLYIPVLNFFSIGYLSRTSRLFLIGGMGFATWEEKYETWIEGVKLLFVFILYNAIPFFMFSAGFFLTTLSSFTAFFGNIMMKLAAFLVFPLCSFFLPFAFTAFAESGDIRESLEFERIFKGIKEVIFAYILGYVATVTALYVVTLLMHIPYFIGFLIASVLSYYILLLSSYYFTELHKKTTLCMQRITPEETFGGH